MAKSIHKSMRETIEQQCSLANFYLKQAKQQFVVNCIYCHWRAASSFMNGHICRHKDNHLKQMITPCEFGNCPYTKV